jgi:ribosome-associated protein
MLVITHNLAIPLREFRFSFARSSGPGGQNVNKVASKATLHWAVAKSAALPEAVRARLLAKHASRVNAEGELLIVSQRFRDAGRNVADCLEKLKTLLVEAATPPRKRIRTKPSRASVRKRLTQKRITSDKKTARRSSGEG